MTLETALMGALSVVTTALTTVVGWLVRHYKRLEKRADDCERDRARQGKDLAELKQRVGMGEGAMMAFRACPAPGCPFKRPPGRYVQGAHVGDAPAFPPEVSEEEGVAE